MNHTRSLFLGTAFALFSLGVMAAELDAFVAASDGATACWSRQYDAAHLAAHPDQQVAAMSMAVTYWDETANGPAQYVFRMEADLRDGTHGTAVGPCRQEGGDVWCGVECDGGGVLLKSRSGGDVLIDLEHTGYIAMTTGCGEDTLDEGFPLESGRDDKQFLLHALPVRQCVPATY
ncbi:hypothetical protein [Devosia sp. FKR38]|uniref:hypothetical protein n=1 Tax=Devosia sp. FKR38 TaxID=2562312 RepID=UPI0010BF947C|nr:hypothetical protein [Devosia sp. FKR38]